MSSDKIQEFKQMQLECLDHILAKPEMWFGGKIESMESRQFICGTLQQLMDSLCFFSVKDNVESIHEFWDYFNIHKDLPFGLVPGRPKKDETRQEFFERLTEYVRCFKEWYGTN